MAAVHMVACLHHGGHLPCRRLFAFAALPSCIATGTCHWQLPICLIVSDLALLPRTRRETRQWMLGTSDGRMPDFLGGRSAVVWAREYSTEDAHKCDCNALRTALSMIPGAKRMVGGACGMCMLPLERSIEQNVHEAGSRASEDLLSAFCQQRVGLLLQVVGHTIQDQGINSACQEQVYRIDVGLSKGCGNGSPEVSLPFLLRPLHRANCQQCRV